VSEGSPASDTDVSGKSEEQTADRGFRYLFADVDFNDAAGTLSVNGNPVAVEPRPLRLLAELLRRVNEVVTKDELFEAVWAGRVTVDHVLANAVSKLRGALGEQGGARIVTLPRQGYRFDGPVQRIAVGEMLRELGIGQPVPGREGYVLERALGAGSKSQVWLARHAKLGQAHVFKFAVNEAQLPAIKREYTLFRVLQAELGPRDDFVRVFDTQFTVAPQFIECEYGGVNLLEWAEADGRLAAMPMAERLALYLQMARAVVAAHSVGVLHKDLKPANVLVAESAGSWKIRLTDFGSGRLIDSDQLDRLQLTAIGMTQAGLASGDSRSGTLMYLAPELLAGQSATMQGDVYALGVMLYQVVTGDLRRPMSTGWERDVADDLLQDDIRAATEGGAASRLQSVDALAERVMTLDARRAARDAEQRVASEAAAALAKLQRIRSRRPWVAALTASLALGLGVSLWFGAQARASQQKAERQAARADAITKFMTTDFMSGVDIRGAGKDASISMRAVLGRAASLANNRFKGEPRTEAVVRGRLADLYFRAGMISDAETQFRLAVERFAQEPLAEASPDVELADIRFGYAQLLAQTNKPDEAQVQMDLAEKERARMPAALAQALERDASNARLFLLMARQQYPAAIPAAKRAVELADGDQRADVVERFNTRLLLVETLYRTGGYAEGLRVIDSALQTLSADQASPVIRARALLLRARVNLAMSKTETVEADLLTARDAFVQHMGPNYADVATANVELGNLYDAQGDFEQSVKVLDQAMTGMAAALGAEHSNTRIVGLNLAIAQINLGRAADGLRSLDAGRPWFVKNMGGDASAVVQAIDFERSRALTTLGRPAEALTILSRLQHERLAEATPARDWAERLEAERGRALLARGGRAEGLALIRNALPHMEAKGSTAWVLAGYRKLVRE